MEARSASRAAPSRSLGDPKLEKRRLATGPIVALSAFCQALPRMETRATMVDPSAVSSAHQPRPRRLASWALPAILALAAGMANGYAHLNQQWADAVGVLYPPN